MKTIVAFVSLLLTLLAPRVAVAGLALGLGMGAPWAQPYNPPVAGIYAWWQLDATYVTVVGGDVASLADKSGNGHVLAQTTALLRPPWTGSSSLLGSQPAAVFAGAQYLDSGAMVGISDTVTIALVAMTSGVGTQFFLDARVPTACATPGIAEDVTAGNVAWFPQPGVCSVSGGGVTNTHSTLIALAGGTGTLCTDGVCNPIGAAGCAAGPYAYLPQLRVGAACTGGFQWVGAWGAMIVWSRQLSQPEIDQANSWLGVVFGVMP